MKFKKDLSDFISISYTKTNRVTNIKTSFWLDSLEAFSEYCWDYAYSGDYGEISLDYINKNEVYNHLCQQTDLSLSALNKEISETEINEWIRRALEDTYINNYTQKWIKAIWERTVEAIKKTYGKEATIYLVKDKQRIAINESCDYIWITGMSDAKEIEIIITQKELKTLYGDSKSMTMQEMFDEIETETADTDFKYEEQSWSYDDTGWLDAFKDIEEISIDILNNRKKKQNRIKQMIQNKVPLSYR